MLPDLIDELIRIRKAWNMPPEDLAQIIGCASGTLRKFETGLRTPSTRMLFKWANALGCAITAEFGVKKLRNNS